jgi:hypothetical protein
MAGFGLATDILAQQTATPQPPPPELPAATAARLDTIERGIDQTLAQRHQEIQAGAAQPAAPAESLPELTGTEAAARPKRTVIPQFKDDPFAAIGFVLQSVAAGAKGQPLPADRLRRQMKEEEENDLRRVMLGMQATEQGLKLLDAAPEDKRGAFIEAWGKKFEPSMGKDFTATFKTLAGRSDRGEVMNALGDYKEYMAPIVKSMGADKALRLFQTKEFREMLDARIDAEAGPIARAKLEATGQILNGASNIPELQKVVGPALDKMPKDANGGVQLTPDQFASLNASLPDQFKLSSAEMASVRRNGFQGQGFEVLSNELAKKVTEKRALAGVEGKPEIKEIERGGRKVLVGIDPKTGKEAWSMNSGAVEKDFKTDDFKAGLAMIASGKFPKGITGGAKEALSSINTPEEAGQMLEAMSSGGFTFEQSPDGGVRLVMGGKSGGMTASQAGQQAQKLEEGEIGSRAALGLIGRVREQMTDEPLFGFAGATVQGLESMVSQAQALAEKAGGTETANILKTDKYKFDKFGAEAGKSAAFKSNIVNLAYALQRARAPGDRITDRDLQSSIDALGSASGSKAQFMAALDEQEQTVKREFGLRYKQTKKQDLPADFWGAPAAPAGGARVIRFDAQGNRLP